MDNKVNSYKKVDTFGKSGLELVVMVYDGAIASLSQAADFYEKKDNQTGFDAIEKAKRFVVHLYTTLDEEKGGEIAANLASIYAYLTERMNFIQSTKDIAAIDNAIAMLRNIREGWVQLSQQVRNKPELSPDGVSGSNHQRNFSHSV